MRRTSRIIFSVIAIALVATGSGCACKWTHEDGLCMKPLFRIHVEINRYDKEECCPAGGQEFNGVDGGVIVPGVVPGGVVEAGPVMTGGFGTSGPLTVETEPLGGFPTFPPDKTAVAGGFLSGSTNPAPVFGPNANLQATTPPASSSGTGTGPGTGTGTQQTAKKRPGSLNVKTGLQLDHAQSGLSPGQNPTLRVGQRTVFGVLVENQGDAAIETTQLQGLFTNNLKPISVIRSSGAAVDQMRTTATSARIDGQRVILDKFDQFGPETKHEYQITAEITATGPGNFEVTQIAGPVIKKNTPITATAQ